MSRGTAVVMPEDEWFKLCSKQCRARRKQYGGTRRECLDEFDYGICAECADDALRAAPKKYRTTAENAAHYDPLPGARP
ncbi:hypothetical protein FHR71_001214 [Methylobacterium sp. RAS18]|nr:hypothetical protein [Methylobacterium sp. RAS18]